MFHTDDLSIINNIWLGIKYFINKNAPLLDYFDHSELLQK